MKMGNREKGEEKEAKWEKGEYWELCEKQEKFARVAEEFCFWGRGNNRSVVIHVMIVKRLRHTLKD